MSGRRKICLVTAMAETTHGMRLARGVGAQCEKYGYDMVQFASMINLDFEQVNYVDGERRVYDLIGFGPFDGIVLDTVSLFYGNSDELTASLYKKIKEQTDAPVVCVGIPYGDLPTVDGSNEPMLRELCCHAIEVHGCRDICLLTGARGNHEAEQRLEIMLRAVEELGGRVRPEHIRYGDFWYTSGEQLARDIVSGKIAKPDAVIAASDHMALGLMQELSRLGREVPEYMVVLGFEANDVAALNRVPLTSVESNFTKCAADAVDYIRAAIEPEEPVLPYEPHLSDMLHIGSSCGCKADVNRYMETFRSKLYYTERNYTPDVFEDNIDIGLMMENYIPELLTSSQTPQECLMNIYLTTYVCSPYVNFFLCMRKDWLSDEADLNNTPLGDMEIAVAKSNNGMLDINKEEQKVSFDASLMLPQIFEEHDRPYVYYFTAVHFLDNTFGYAVLQREFKDIGKFNLVYRNWIRFVSNALEMVRSKNRFVVLSSHDKMTGLLNRRGMYDRLEKLLGRIQPGERLFVCVADMDGLKYINDNFGHHEGDFGIKLLGRAADAVKNKEDLCARTGGDEFVIAGLCRDFDREGYEKRFSAELDSLSRQAGKPYPITASIGIAVGEKDAPQDFENLFSKADEDMYRYKTERKKQRS